MYMTHATINEKKTCYLNAEVVGFGQTIEESIQNARKVTLKTNETLNLCGTFDLALIPGGQQVLPKQMIKKY